MLMLWWGDTYLQIFSRDINVAIVPALHDHKLENPYGLSNWEPVCLWRVKSIKYKKR